MAQARLRFAGPEDAVEVPGITKPVLIGEEIDVPGALAGQPSTDDELGWGLLAQTYTDPATGEQVPSWVPATKPAPAKPAATVKEG